MLKNILIIGLIAVLGFFLYRAYAPEEQESNITNNTGENVSPTVTKNSKSTLNLSNQGLNKLPAYVFDRTDLEELDISNNNLDGALPGEIRHLSNLRVLNASNNKMTGVPAEIGQLTKLETLDLSNNQLTGLPYELGNLQNLKTLNLSGNNYSEQDLEIIRKDLPQSTQIITE